MPDIKPRFSINVKYKDHSEFQNFSMKKGDDSICLYEKGQDNALIMVEPLKKDFTIDNTSHRFDEISKDDVIILHGIENVSAESNNDFILTLDTQKGKRTYKISHNALSVKKGRSFEPVVSFEHPLDVSLPESLPSQIANNNIKMSTFPAQMTQMLVEDYGYNSLKLENGMTILKSPNGKIIFPDGAKLSTSTTQDIVKAPSGLVLRFLPSAEMKKMKENQVKKGINITENDFEALNKFMGKNQSIEDIPTLTSDSSYVKLRKSSVAYRVGKEEQKNNNDNKNDSKEKQTPNYVTNHIDNLSIDNTNYTVNTDNWESNFGNNFIYNESDSITQSEVENTEQNQDETQKAIDIENQENTEMNTANADSNGDDSSSPSATLTEDKQAQSSKAWPENNQSNAFAVSDKQRENESNEKKESSTSKQENKNQDKNASENKDQKQATSDAAQEVKKNDEKQKKTMDEKKFNMMHKGIRFILLVVAANFFMAAMMFANPLFAVIAIMSLFGMVTSGIMQQSKFRFSTIFSIGNDIVDYIKAKHSIKELTKSETKKMNKLLEKQSKGLSQREQKKLDKLQSSAKKSKFNQQQINKLLKKQANGLSKNEQKKLDMLLTRNEYKLSQNEYKHFINNETPAMKAVNNYRALAQKQEDAFRLSKAQTLAAIDKDIAYRKEYLEVGKNVIPEQNQKAIKEDINHLIAYRNSVDDVQNISQDINRKNIGDIEQSLIDKPRNWLDNELDIEQTTFEEIVKTNGVKQPTLEIDTQTLIENEPELIRRVEALEQSETQQSTNKNVNETKQNDNSNNDKSAFETIKQQQHNNNQTTKQDDGTSLTL